MSNEMAVTDVKQLPLVLTVEEFGQIARVSRNQAYALAKSIYHIRQGSRILVPRASVEKMLNGDQ